MTYETAMSTYKAYSQKNGAKWGEVAYVRPCLRNKGVVLGPCRTIFSAEWLVQGISIVLIQVGPSIPEIDNHLSGPSNRWAH